MTTLSITTILCEVVPADGVAAWLDPWGGPGIRTVQATPPASFGNWTPGDVPVRITHDGPTAGFLDYLEHGLGYGMGALFGVGVIGGVSADLIDGKVMASAEIRANARATTVPATSWTNGHMRSSAKVVGEVHATRAELHGVALVERTASITATMVRAWPGDYRDPADRGRWITPTPDIIARAIEAAPSSLRWSRPEYVRIHHPVEQHHSDTYDSDLRHAGGRPEILHTAPYSGGILDVRSA